MSQRRLWSCAPHWESEYILRYFLDRSLEWAHTRFGGRERNGATWLHLLALAGHEKLLSMFMEKGLDINSRDWAGNTVLHVAAAAGEVTMVEVLIEKRADVLAVNRMNQSVLSYSMSKNSVLGRTLERPAKALRPVIDAMKARGGDLSTCGDASSIPPIFLAARAVGGKSILEYLLASGIDIFQTLPSTNDTLLHCAAYYGRESVGEFLVNSMKIRPDFLSLLNVQRKSPLHISIEGGRLSLANALISAGADLELLDNLNRDSIDLALCCRGFDIFEDLLKRFPPFSKAGAVNRFQQALWKFIKAEDSVAVRHIVKLQETCKIEFRLPPLHYLIQKYRNSVKDGHEIIEAIGEAGADVLHLSKPFNETPLHAAIRKPIENNASRDHIISYLLHKVNDLSLLTRQGDSVLHHAARFGSPKTVALILQHHKMTPEIFALENNAGNTALHEAVNRSGNNKKVVKLLMKAREEYYQKNLREKISARSPRKIGKPAVPDPPVGEGKNVRSPSGSIRMSACMEISLSLLQREGAEEDAFPSYVIES